MALARGCLERLRAKGIGNRAPTTIVILRDPRDEAISRLHYAAYHFFSTRPTSDDDRADWIDIFRRKEETPGNIGLIDMEHDLRNRFGVGFRAGRELYELYLRFIDDVVGPHVSTVHLLRYEDFVRGTIAKEPLQNLLSGRRDVGPEFRRVFRSGSSGEWQYFLTDSDLSSINEASEPILRRFGYPFERTSGSGRPSRATGTDYVEKLIDEARAVFERNERRE